MCAWLRSLFYLPSRLAMTMCARAACRCRLLRACLVPLARSTLPSKRSLDTLARRCARSTRCALQCRVVLSAWSPRACTCAPGKHCRHVLLRVLSEFSGGVRGGCVGWRVCVRPCRSLWCAATAAAAAAMSPCARGLVGPFRVHMMSARRCFFVGMGAVGVGARVRRRARGVGWGAFVREGGAFATVGCLARAGRALRCVCSCS